MAVGHRCDLIEQWSADPRSPLEERIDGYYLAVSGQVVLSIAFCPFCGDEISTGMPPTQRPLTCHHLEELARDPESSVRYLPESEEYQLMARDSLKIRLFFCPACGSRLPINNNEQEFCERSALELAKWAKLSEGINTIALALARFGKPDLDQGPTKSYMYLHGKRTEVGTTRALFYHNLAQTFTVAAIEWLDGGFDIKFYPKEKTPSTPKPSGEQIKE